ncbi:hypothetical protein H5410_009098 [Solanum commersonii]|uniref:Uncharacterized protein n=1 Tax=Solanum commersonii TaxID=4109 RepID=A0A9J6AH19_SOLCO|nr:hypothetical protein H5410_009098 [Solanum commersonii]
MNSSTNKGTQGVKAPNQMESVNYESSVGQGQEQRPAEVIHQPQIQSNTSGGVLANAAASVASTLESAKRAISRK